MKRFVSVGECMIEMSGGEDGNYRLGYAGDTLNTAWYARAALGNDWSVDYVTALGDDLYSQQMVDFFHAHSGEDEADVQSETDRYIAWPGQALAYKLGQLKITELRERAKQQLGAKYDVRKFHDEILDGGALPLDVMDARVQAWISTQISSRSNEQK